MFAQDEPGSADEEFRAAFVTVAFNFDWPKTAKDAVNDQIQQIEAVVERAEALHLNVIVLQVRSFEDRIFRAKARKEDWSRFVAEWPANPDDYQPLDEWINQCHAHGLELHVWVNPFRGKKKAAPIGTDEKPWFEKKQYWHDPTDAQVQIHIRQIIRDLLDYKTPRAAFVKGGSPSSQPTTKPKKRGPKAEGDTIDGVLVDHYVPDPPDPDGKRKIKIKKDSVTQFVKDLYDMVQKESHVKFGISPDSNPFENPMCDVKGWIEKRYFHYLVPELYIHPGNDFSSQFGWYLQSVEKSTDNGNPMPTVVAGLITRRVAEAEWVGAPTWPSQDIVQEINDSRTIPAGNPTDANVKAVARGQAHYSWKGLRASDDEGPVDNIGDRLKADIYRNGAIVPRSKKAPGPMQDKATNLDVQPVLGAFIATWDGKSDWLWEFWQRDKSSGKWRMKLIGGTETNQQIESNVDRIAIRAVNHYSVEGETCVHRVP